MTARSGMGYVAKGPKRDARLAQALRGVATRYLPTGAIDERVGFYGNGAGG